MYESFLEAYDQAVSASRLLRRTRESYGLVRRFGFRSFRLQAEWCVKEMKGAGFRSVEMIPVPADGKTVFQDKIMPLAWDAEFGRLEVIGRSGFSDPVVADWEREPNHLTMGSPSTPEGGIDTFLVTEEQMRAGTSVKGRFVLASPDHRSHETYRAVCDMGGLGIVSDWNMHRHENLDGVSWDTWFTEGPNWWPTLRDRPLIGFSVSPRVGDRLRAAANRGPLEVRAEVRARRYEGEFHIVTGIIPGAERPEKEIWLLAHLYEPNADDNSSGVAASIEIGQVLNELIESGRLSPPRYTIRPVFTYEVYGYAAYVEKRREELANVLTGIVLDSIAMSRWRVPGPLVLTQSPPANSFFGDGLLEEILVKQLGERDPSMARETADGSYGDDGMVSDPTIGIPTVRLVRSQAHYWHSSLNNMDVIDQALLRNVTVTAGAYAAFLASMGEKEWHWIAGSVARQAEDLIRSEAERLREKVAGEGSQDLERTLEAACKRLWYLRDRGLDRLRSLVRWLDGTGEEEKGWLKQLEEGLVRAEEDWRCRLPGGAREAAAGARAGAEVEHLSRARRMAQNMVCKRVGRGFPMDLANVPEERRVTGVRLNYAALARMDGERNLLDVADILEGEAGRALSDGEIRSLVGTCELLSDHGYLETRYAETVSQADIEGALRKVGVREGDLLYVHSSMSSMGHVDGGADAVIDALLAVLGPSGTLLMPAFTVSVFYWELRSAPYRDIRPYHSKKSAAWVGRIPTTFMKREGVIRSAHPTHSTAAFGPLAQECLRDHLETDSPTSRRSPLGKLVDFGGKILFFGVEKAPCTFIHMLEDCLNMPFLVPACSLVERDDGKVEMVTFPRFLPGDRDWYGTPSDERKLFKALYAGGLGTKLTTLGLGTLEIVEARPFYEIGLRVIGEDPTLLLCDDPRCKFCSEYKEIIRQTWAPPQSPIRH